MIWVFAADGTTENPGAKMYPAIICNTCDEPVHGGGLLAWKVPEVPADGDKWVRRWQAMFFHKGNCIRAAEQKVGHLYTQELAEALANITYNFEHPFTGNDLSEWKRAQPTAGYRPDGPALRR